MADMDSRIAQFKNMAEADPDNELGHFSLGKAYIDAKRYAEAEQPLRRVLQLNPAYSKAYEMLGKALVESGRRADAVSVLEQGYAVAAERGDVMPREQIANMLAELGHAPPPIAASAGRPAAKPVDASSAASASGFRCARCGRPHGQLPKAPFKGPLGMKILAQSCSECWKEWIPTGTKVINEMGLALADPKAQELYDEYMKEFLQLDP
ncbi:MAG: hypothetical protein HOP29_09530 [Phycisphaerales bacterium]|nr:hypothetical protein [Phycisphaerales bacterium]